MLYGPLQTENRNCLELNGCILNSNLVQGVLFQKSKVNGSIAGTLHYWPHVGETNMCLRGGKYFQFYFFYTFWSDLFPKITKFADS